MTSEPQAEPEWLKFLDPELRQKPLVPTEALANALKNMPADHRDRLILHTTLERMLRIKQNKNNGGIRCMQAGQQLKVSGLESDAKLNGEIVTLECWLPEKERWRCVTSEQVPIAVRPRNLAPVNPA